MRLSILFLLAFSFKCLLPFAQNKVLIIGIDGCRSDAFELANTPNLDELKKNGIFCPTSWQMGKTKSGPGWSSMLTGVWDNKHNVNDNKFSKHKFDQYPFFPQHIKNYDNSKKSAIVVGWKSLLKVSKKNKNWDVCINGKSDNDCLAQISKLVTAAEQDIYMVHFNDVDFAGHTTGFEPNNPKYIQAIEEVDRKIGELMKTLKSRPQYSKENWLILSSTDHGGTGMHHSGNSIQERKVWWIASASFLPKLEINANDPGSYFYTELTPDSTIINSYPSIVDIAVTAIHHMLPSADETNFKAWGLDGKSWLNFNPKEKNELHLNVSSLPNEAKFSNNSGSINMVLKELKK
jgi:predicted AlkP superfamily pyrophosphatase or phosphodiesterase